MATPASGALARLCHVAASRCAVSRTEGEGMPDQCMRVARGLQFFYAFTCDAAVSHNTPASVTICAVPNLTKAPAPCPWQDRRCRRTASWWRATGMPGRWTSLENTGSRPAWHTRFAVEGDAAVVVQPACDSLLHDIYMINNPQSWHFCAAG